jgi:RNA polymerase sigma-70 factor (ECF subfamily)
MYNFGMTIASRYGNTLAEAEDIANEGFYKVLKNISKYKTEIPFLAWVRRIIINCAIDNYRKNKGSKNEITIDPIQSTNKGSEFMESEYLLIMVRSLTPQYKMVFNLHAIEGYTHAEIADRLNITIGTSKSNLAKARKKLQQMVTMYNQNIAHVRE